MSNMAFPGLSAAIGRAGAPVYEDAFRWADRKKARSDVADASIPHREAFSKPGYLGDDLHIDEGRKLNLKLNRARSSARTTDSRGLIPHVDEITVEHLLTHTGGGGARGIRCYSE